MTAPGFSPLNSGGGGGGTGEANTTSNSGTGEGLALPKVGVDLPFKTLKEGPGITLTPSADEVEISAAGIASHPSLANLTGSGADGDAGHSQNVLLTGRTGGQTVLGGLAPGDSLRLEGPNTVELADNTVMVGDLTFLPSVAGQGSIGTFGTRFKTIAAEHVIMGDAHFHHPTNGAKWRLVERLDGLTMVNENTGVEFDLVLKRRRDSIATRISELAKRIRRLF